MPALTPGTQAPPFELTSSEGKKFSLDGALARGPVLAAFFKVGCPTCQFAFPFIERIYQQFRDGKVTILGISQDDASHTKNFAAQYGVTFPILIDDEPYETSKEYNLKFTPTLFLIAPDKTVEFISEGFSKRDLLEIQKMLAHKLQFEAQPLFLPNEHVPEYKPG
jgi:peroxiredoxin